jgi:hypothetical protein
LAATRANRNELAVAAATPEAMHQRQGTQAPTEVQYPMVFHDECINVKAKSDGTGLLWVTFTNTCSQLVVIKEYLKKGDGTWDAGEDCRSNGKWILAFTNAESAQYIVHAQTVKTCADMYLLKWPPAPK